MTATRGTIRNVVDEFVPDGPFWEGAAAERFVDALTDAVLDAGVFVSDLRDAIFPGTASRAVLLQWWNYIDTLSCLPVPVDTEELRASVALLLSAADVDTPSGLESRITAFLPFVDVRESLPTSTLPADVPFDVEPTGRCLEIWYPPLLHTREQVDCVARPFQRAADALRPVAPEGVWYTNGNSAGENAIAWTFGTDCRLHVEYSDTAGGLAIEAVDFTLPTQHGVRVISDFFTTLNSTDIILEREFRWWFTKDFGDGHVQITAQATELLAATPQEIVEAIAGLSLTSGFAWVGDNVDVVASKTLVQVGTATENETTTELFAFDGAPAVALETTDGANGWEAPDFTTMDIGTASTILLLVFRTTNGAPPAIRNVFGDRDSGTGDGAEVAIVDSGATTDVQWNVGTTFRATSANDYGDDAWHVFLGRFDNNAKTIDLATELESMGTVAQTGNAASPTREATIGRGRLSAPDVQVHLAAWFEGAQCEGVSLTTIATRVHRYMVND